MKNVQIPQELFMKLLRYHLLDDDSCTEEVKNGLEQKMNAMVERELYTRSPKLPRRRRNGKKPGRSIWTGVEYRRISVGSSFLTTIGQARGTLLYRWRTRKSSRCEDGSFWHCGKGALFQGILRE